MDYHKFSDSFSNLKDLKLPGKSLFSQLSSKHKIKYLDNNLVSTVNVRKAGVMLFCYPKNNNMHLSLIKRSKYDGVHSGQICLPGGKQEKEDISIWNTARRECREELGVFLTQNKPMIALTPTYIPPSNFLVSPFVTFEKTYPSFNPNRREVAMHIELPLKELIKFKIKQLNLNEASCPNKKVLGFIFDNHIIWGATAKILLEFKFLLESRF
jgi:8-oxo-dGTP pyrophosphatase MutT (NUDIX family)